MVPLHLCSFFVVKFQTFDGVLGGGGGGGGHVHSTTSPKSSQGQGHYYMHSPEGFIESDPPFRVGEVNICVH